MKQELRLDLEQGGSVKLEQLDASGEHVELSVSSPLGMLVSASLNSEDQEKIRDWLGEEVL